MRHIYKYYPKLWPKIHQNLFYMKSYLFLLICFFFGWNTLTGQHAIIVDADTGNEVDDPFALVRILLEPEVKVLALNAAQWQASQWAVAQSMENSHRLNQQLLGEMGLSVKTLRGGRERMYDWGDRAQHSAASYGIIEEARQLPQGEKLSILVLGALTNVASAVFIAPDIAPKLKVYWLGTTMDFNTGVLKRNDFNCAMDPFALDFMLESEIEMNIMPVSVAAAMEIDRQTVQEQIGDHPLGQFLMHRWYTHIDGGRKKRVLWDLALVAAFLHPEMATTKTVKTSRDSGNRNITFYDSIHAEAIYQDFYTTLSQFEKTKP
jgi:inosine-uridine nucleoside N-ribohydrolase